jgi:putative transposase
LRPALGNFGTFKAAGSFTKTEWCKDKLVQSARSKNVRGRKRSADGETRAADPEPVYLRTIKMRVRFVGEREARHRQQRILAGWCGSARYTYNACLRGVQRDGMPLKVGDLRSRYVSATAQPQKGAKPTTDEGWERKRKRDEAKAATQAALGYAVGELVRAKPWLLHTPSYVRDNAMQDLVDAQKAMEAKAKLARERGDTGDHQRWTLHQREGPSGNTIKLTHGQDINAVAAVPRPTTKQVTVDAHNPGARRRTWTKLTLCPRFKCFDGKPLGDVYLSEDVVGKFGGIHHDCRLTRDERGRFFLHVPIDTPLPEPVPLAARRPVALDPGVRTFQAAHAPEGHGTFADGDFERVLRPLCEALDALQSRRDRMRAKWEAGQWSVGPTVESWLPGVRDGPRGALYSYTRAKRKLERRMAKLRDRVKQLVDECHKHVAHELLTRFDTVLIPVFESSKMAAHEQEHGGRRRLSSATTRALLGWAHWRFRERLKHAALRRGKEVVVIDESYTTKGCSRCGLITEIGGSKTFRCAHCGLQAPRDAKSARDILAKHVLPAAAA